MGTVQSGGCAALVGRCVAVVVVDTRFQEKLSVESWLHVVVPMAVLLRAPCCLARQSRFLTVLHHIRSTTRTLQSTIPVGYAFGLTSIAVTFALIEQIRLKAGNISGKSWGKEGFLF
jgi:hypothetical protein